MLNFFRKKMQKFEKIQTGWSAGPVTTLRETSSPAAVRFTTSL
jgi:hypothetical protein